MRLILAHVDRFNTTHILDALDYKLDTFTDPCTKLYKLIWKDRDAVIGDIGCYYGVLGTNHAALTEEESDVFIQQNFEVFL